MAWSPSSSCPTRLTSTPDPASCCACTAKFKGAPPSTRAPEGKTSNSASPIPTIVAIGSGPANCRAHRFRSDRDHREQRGGPLAVHELVGDQQNRHVAGLAV